MSTSQDSPDQAPTSPDPTTPPSGGQVPRRTITTPPGGILTREVGAITGQVDVWIDPERPRRLSIGYTGALDIYTVVGSTRQRDLDTLIAVLTTDPGVDADGNPIATHL